MKKGRLIHLHPFDLTKKWHQTVSQCWTSVPGVVVIPLISNMEELAVIPVSVHKTNKRGCYVFTQMEEKLGEM